MLGTGTTSLWSPLTVQLADTTASCSQSTTPAAAVAPAPAEDRNADVPSTQPAEEDDAVHA